MSVVSADKDRIFKRLLAVLRDPDHGQSIEEDLRSGPLPFPSGSRRLSAIYSIRQKIKAIST
jgi:hypothetical protein